MEALLNAEISSCLDLKSAYNQVAIAKEDQYKTAFSSPWGLYEFTKMAFGVINAPATFQRIMSTVFRDYIFKFVVCYLDDVLIFSKSREEYRDQNRTNIIHIKKSRVSFE